MTDPRITESSGLVDLGDGLMVTTNDSGDTGIVYVVDRSGRTVGTTRFGDSVDAEALAPVDGGHVWVGDIGDNEARRPYTVIRRVPVGRGDRTVRVPSYRLLYPDGPHDAETLLRQPATGRLFVVTKGILGGRVYAVPRHLRSGEQGNRLRAVAKVGLFATDGTFLDAHRVLVRGYTSADVYVFPGFRLLGSFALPGQPQGESVSVGPGGRIRIGSEGVRSEVVTVSLPARLRAATPTSPAASPSRVDDTPAGSGKDGPVDHGSGQDAPRAAFWAVFGAIAAGLAGLALVVRRRRTRA
jgi:hypothetical protein